MKTKSNHNDGNLCGWRTQLPRFDKASKKITNFKSVYCSIPQRVSLFAPLMRYKERRRGWRWRVRANGLLSLMVPQLDIVSTIFEKNHHFEVSNFFENIGIIFLVYRLIIAYQAILIYTILIHLVNCFV